MSKKHKHIPDIPDNSRRIPIPIPQSALKLRFRQIGVSVAPFAVLALLGLAIYANTFHCTFHFDDVPHILENTAIRFPGNPAAFWKAMNLRSVGALTFALNYHLHKFEVPGYHAVNLIVHIVTSWLIWWFVSLLLSTPVMEKHDITRYKKFLAFGAGLLFLTHPLQTQAITYIVQRYASLAALFYIAAICCYMKARLARTVLSAGVWFVLMSTVGLLGVLTKENTFTMPFAMLLIEFAFFTQLKLGALKKNKRILAYLTPPFIFALSIPFFVHKYYFKSFALNIISQRYEDPPLTNMVYLLTQFKVVVHYILLLFFPVGLSIDHDIPASRSFFEPGTMLGFLFLAGVFVLALWLFKRDRLISVGILWFFLTLSIESSVIPLGNVMFEHRVYLPMAGFILVAVSVMYRLLKRYSRGAVVAVLILAICYSVMTFQRNRVWSDDITLWSDAMKKEPDKLRTSIMLGLAYYNEKEYDKAESIYRKALALGSKAYASDNKSGMDYFMYSVLNSLGLIYYDSGKYQDALNIFNEIIKIRPDDAEGYYNLGNTQYKLGHLNEAEQSFTKALLYNPAYAKAYYNLGTVLFDLGNYEESIKNNTESLKYEPDNPGVYYNLGTSYLKVGNFEQAIRSFQISIKLNPSGPDAYFNLGNTFASAGRTQEAIQSFQSALERDPRNADAHRNIAELYASQERYVDAIREFEAALALDPGNPLYQSGRARYLEKAGKSEDAVDALKKAGEAGVNNPAVQFGLAQEAYNNKDLDSARNRLEKVIELDPNHEQARFLLGVVLAKQGKREESFQSFLEVIRINPENADALSELGTYYQNRGNTAEAQKYFDRAAAAERKKPRR